MLNDRALRARILPFLAAFAFYSAIVLVLTFPLVREISSHAPADARDAFFSTWILWWNAHHVPLTNDWWNAPIFYPTSGALAFSETFLGLAPLTTPIQWLGGSPVLVYNVMFLLSFPLSAMAAHGLGFSLTRRHDAALITGLAFGFNPYRISQLPHLQMLSSFWMPVALLGLHAFARTGRMRSVVLFVVAWLMQGLSNGYYLLFLPVLVGLWLLWFVPPWTNSRRVALILTSWAAAAVLFAPLAFSYYTIQQRAGMRQSFGQIAAAGAHLSSLLNMSPLLWLWRSPFPSLEPEKQLFPGATVLVLIAAGVVFAVRNQAGVKRAYQRHSPFAFYVCAAGVMWVLSLGPAPTLRGVTFWPGAPYSWLMIMPGFSSVRVPARFAALMMLCLSTAAGLAFVRLAPLNIGRRLAFTGLIVAGILADTWTRGTPIFAAPSAEHLLDTAPPSAAVLELPLGDETTDSLAVYGMTSHQRPVVNGYTSYFPAHYAALSAGLNEHDDDMLNELAAYGPLAIVVDGGAEPDRSWTRYVEQHAGIRRIRSSEMRTLFWVDAAERRARPQLGDPLPIAGLTANRGGPALHAVTDGTVASAWQSGAPQRGGEEIIADLGSVQPVRAAEMWLGTATQEFPRELRIAVSRDGREWEDAWRGHGIRAGIRRCTGQPARDSNAL